MTDDSIANCQLSSTNCQLIRAKRNYQLNKMLYYLFGWLGKEFHMSGAGLFQFITFRAVMAIILSLAIATMYGKRLINVLKRNQIGETVRDLGLAGEQQKKGTPTMG